MTKLYKKYDPNFKADIALSAIRPQKSLLELASAHSISKTLVAEWRDKLLADASSLFLPEHEKNKKLKSFVHEIEVLHKIIGEITIENNFLKKKLVR